MSSAWDFLRGMRPRSGHVEEVPPRQRERAIFPDLSDEMEYDDARRSPEAGGRLENLGEQNELLHVRFAYMADRLEDLKSLTEDFNLLTRPIEEMASELPRAKARVLEVEALLSRELKENRTLKAELTNASEQLSVVVNDHNSLKAQHRSLQEAVERSEAIVADDRVKIAELNQLLGNAERQAAIEAENRERLNAEVSSLSIELSQRYDELQAAEDRLSRQTGRNDELDRENKRLQKIVDQQVVQVVDLQARSNELERGIQNQAQEIHDLRGKLEVSQAERQKSDHNYEITVSSLSAEKSSLSLKVDALNARLASAEQSANQAREQLSEREAALRHAEDALRTSGKERAAMERRIAGLENNVADYAEQLRDGQRVINELNSRCDMLGKALSAKDAALESALDKARARSERVDELTKRYEQERASLETTNRRLVEELENEKAERTLAQGALKIARESRASLQRQNEALKRANRAMRTASSSDEPEPEREPRRVSNGEPASNVSVFAPPQKDLPDED